MTPPLRRVTPPAPSLVGAGRHSRPWAVTRGRGPSGGTSESGPPPPGGGPLVRPGLAAVGGAAVQRRVDAARVRREHAPARSAARSARPRSHVVDDASERRSSAADRQHLAVVVAALAWIAAAYRASGPAWSAGSWTSRSRSRTIFRAGAGRARRRGPPAAARTPGRRRSRPARPAAARSRRGRRARTSPTTTAFQRPSDFSSTPCRREPLLGPDGSQPAAEGPRVLGGHRCAPSPVRHRVLASDWRPALSDYGA